VQAESGDTAGALRTVALIEKNKEDDYVRSMVQASIAQAQMKGGDANGAQKSLASARKLATSLPDMDRRDAALRQIALVQVQTGDVAGSLAVVEQIDSVY